MDRVRIAVIGLGRFGELHAQAYVQSSLADLVAVVNTTEARTCEVGAKLGVCWYTDFHAMLKKHGVDSVSISSLEADHMEPAIACARAGRHMLLDEPMAPAVEEADAIIDAVGEPGGKMVVNFTNRFAPDYVAAHEAIETGDIGEIMSVLSRRSISRWAMETYGKWTDVLISTGIHETDTTTWYADSKVRQVYGESSRFSVPQE